MKPDPSTLTIYGHWHGFESGDQNNVLNLENKFLILAKNDPHDPYLVQVQSVSTIVNYKKPSKLLVLQANPSRAWSFFL